MDRIKKLIINSSKAAILTHISEDADALGSAAAIKSALSALGKKADIYISAEIENRLKFMDVDCIIYNDEKIPPYDLCICVDCGDLKRLGNRIKIFEAAEHTVNIDHHVTNISYAEENLVVGAASSAGEIVYGVIKSLGVEITKEIAFYLYTAISSDSGCFKYSSVTPETMRIAADLIETGIDHAEICRKLFDTETRNVIRLKGHIAENLHEYEDGKICVAAADDDMLKKYDVKEKDLGDLVNIPRKVEGCEIAVSVREANGKIKVSLRSDGKYDVSAIALSYGGGGHKRAAGITLEGIGIDEAEKQIVADCKKELR